MLLRIPRGKPKPSEPARDPRELHDWFQRLPESARDEIRRDWRADAERTLALESGAKRQLVRDALAMAAVFVLGDLICPGMRVWTPLTAAAIGAGLGALCSAINAERLLTGSLGLASFFAFQWASRSGLAPLHLLVFFNFGAVCAYLGYQREERGTL